MIGTDGGRLFLQIVEHNDHNPQCAIEWLDIANRAGLCDLVELQTKPLVFSNNRKVTCELPIDCNRIIRWR